MPPKTVCPISRKDFDVQAKPLEIVIDGESMKVPVKKFSTGSLGWYLNKKMDVKINGVAVTVQIGLNMTIVGSKDLKHDEPPPGEAGHATHAPAAPLAQHDPHSTIPPE